MKKKTYWILLASVSVALIGFLFLIPPTRDWVLKVAGLLGSLDIEAVKDYIRSFGVWSVAVSFALMVFQSLAAPLPAFLITFANAALFGWAWGALLSWTSAMAGAALCFGIARLYGRGLVNKLAGTGAIKATDEFFARYGTNSILIARLLPFMPFDIISYGAGLTAMGFCPFFLATGLGQLPATLVYSWSGSMLTGGAQTFLYGLCAVFALAALSWLLKSLLQNRKARGAAGAAPAAAAPAAEGAADE